MPRGQSGEEHAALCVYPLEYGFNLVLSPAMSERKDERMAERKKSVRCSDERRQRQQPDNANIFLQTVRDDDTRPTIEAKAVKGRCVQWAYSGFGELFHFFFYFSSLCCSLRDDAKCAFEEKKR